jgi:hypothetical protein
LKGNCADIEGYKIALLNTVHYESVVINKTFDYPVIIKFCIIINNVRKIIYND